MKNPFLHCFGLSLICLFITAYLGGENVEQKASPWVIWLGLSGYILWFLIGLRFFWKYLKSNNL